MTSRTTRREILRTGFVGGAVAISGCSAFGQRSDQEVEPSGETWPMFRYDAQNTGYAPENTGPDEPPSVKWDEHFTNTGSLLSSPSVTDGTLYVGHPGAHVGGDRTLRALSAKDGGGEWSFDGMSTDSSPAVVNGSVYVGSGDGGIYSLDATDGTEQWRVDTGYVVTSSPTVVDGTVYVGGADGALYAIDAANGEILWRYLPTTAEKQLANASPAVYDEQIYVTATIFTENDRYPYVVSLSENGAEEWRYEFPDAYGSPSSPAVANDTVYVSIPSIGIVALDATTGDRRWQKTIERGGAINGVSSSPAIAGDLVYGTGGSQRLFALDRRKGTDRWSVELGHPTISSPVVADGSVYIGTDNRHSRSGAPHLFAIDANSGTVEWQWESNLPITTTPTVVDGTVFVGNDKLLYALSADSASD